MTKRWVVLGSVTVTWALAACSGTDPGPGSEVSNSGTAGSGGAGGGLTLMGGSAGATSSGGKAGGGSMSGGGGTSGGSAMAGSSSGGSGGNGGSSGKAGGGSGGGQTCDPVITEDKGSGACHDFTPCGGDVVGSWDMTLCADPPLQGLKSLCASATETLSLTGPIETRADGTMTSTVSVKSETLLPSSCVSELGQCGVASALNLLASCTPADAGSCLCAAESESDPSEASYTTDGSTITVVNSGCPNVSHYCRQGDELWLRGQDSAGRVTVLHLTKR